MSNPNIKPSDQAVLIGIIDPDAYAAAAYSTAWVHMGTFEAVQALVLVGDFVATGVLNAKLEQATDGSGTGVKDITGKAITALTQAGTDDNKQAEINCWANQLDVAGGFDYVRLTVTLTTAGADMGALLLGHYARYQPAADLTTVDEIVG